MIIENCIEGPQCQSGNCQIIGCGRAKCCDSARADFAMDAPPIVNRNRV